MLCNYINWCYRTMANWCSVTMVNWCYVTTIVYRLQLLSGEDTRNCGNRPSLSSVNQLFLWAMASIAMLDCRRVCDAMLIFLCPGYMRVFAKWGYPNMDGWFHGKSFEHGWYGGSSVLGNHHILWCNAMQLIWCCSIMGNGSVWTSDIHIHIYIYIYIYIYTYLYIYICKFL